MAGSKYTRLPGASSFNESILSAVKYVNITDKAQNTLNRIQNKQITQLRNDINILSSAVERELLKMSHKISEDDSVSVTDQIAWFMNTV